MSMAEFYMEYRGNLDLMFMEMEEQNKTYYKSKKQRKLEKDAKSVRISKSLAYVLRYGAIKEGLQVNDGGYVRLDKLLHVPMLRSYDQADVLEEINQSMGYRKTKRFETKEEASVVYVRAPYGRRMERNPYHDNSHVVRLLDTCLDKICNDLESYDLETFPDEYLLNSMIHLLKRKKKLSNNALRNILGPNIEHLDLDGVYITENTVKLIGSKCPYLKLLSLKDCGYLMTDHLLAILLKKTPDVETLNLSGCKHLSDQSMFLISKRLPNLKHLNICNLTNISEASILHLATACSRLKHLDIFWGNKVLTDRGTKMLQEVALQKDLQVVLKGFST